MYYLHLLSEQIKGFNVFSYVTFRAVAQDKIENITARNDAHQVFVLHHGQRADSMAAQQTDRRRQRSFRAHDEDIMRHHLFDGHLGGKPIDFLASIDHHARRIGIADVTVGDDPDQVIVIQDWQLVHPMLRHHLARKRDAVETLDREDFLSHPIGDAHNLGTVFILRHHFCSTR